MVVTGQRKFHVAIMKGEGGYDLAHTVELSRVFILKSLSELGKTLKEEISSDLQTWAAHIDIPGFIRWKRVRIYLDTRNQQIQTMGIERLRSGRHEFHVAIMRGEHGEYIARVAELPGLNMVKDSLSELDREIRETIPPALEVESLFYLPKVIKLKKVRI